MPALKNARHEKFCQLYPHARANGQSQGDICIAAGFTPKTAHSADVMGSRILKRPDILARLAEIGAPATRKAKIDTETYLAKFERVFEGASADKQFGPATRAAELQARMTGHLVDRSEIKASISFDDVNTVDDVVGLLLADTTPHDAIATLKAMIDAIEQHALLHAVTVVTSPDRVLQVDEAQVSAALFRKSRKNGRGSS